ncbi:MAG: TlpA family protein disulfide reductase [Bacteroidales bacterium]|nr:TlpA family protein disulfide reductase [Bacteroidales bacterium]
MKKLLILTLTLIFPILASAQKGLPNVEVTDLEGNVVNIQSVLDEGVPVVISFWYTTCKPCLQELGAINDVYSDWQDEAEFKFIAVSTDDSRSSSKVAPMVRGRGWSDFTFYLDVNGDLKRAMNVQTQPTVILLDRNGEIVYTHIGYTPGNEEELFEEILKVQ